MKKKSIHDAGRLFNAPRSQSVAPQSFLADIAIGLWRVESALRQEHAMQDDVEQLRSFRHLQRVREVLETAGIVILDPTGGAYDAGMSVRVVATEERPDVDNATIVESITPSVFVRDNLIHPAEIVVAVPPKATTDDAPAP